MRGGASFASGGFAPALPIVEMPEEMDGLTSTADDHNSEISWDSASQSHSNPSSNPAAAGAAAAHGAPAGTSPAKSQSLAASTATAGGAAVAEPSLSPASSLADTPTQPRRSHSASTASPSAPVIDGETASLVTALGVWPPLVTIRASANAG